MPLLVTDPIDLLLDSSGDLVIENGDLAFSSGVDGVGQAIRVAVRLVRGEWFLNLDAGVPWLERDGVDSSEAILGQQFQEAKAISAFRDAIIAVPGVAAIDSLTATYDNTTRLLTIAWSVTTVFDNTVADSLTRES